MAQLVKLYDYISRYETNPFHYPSQYIRLKQRNWEKLEEKWQQEANEEKKKYPVDDVEPEKKNNKWNPFTRLKSTEESAEVIDYELPATQKQLKKYFLNQLFPVQMKWATSTLRQASFNKMDFRNTQILKYFLQRFPDIYLLMFYPIFNIQKAPIDGDLILIGPHDIEIICLINHDPDVTIVATNDRQWALETTHQLKTILSPLISLKRTEQIVRSILNSKKIGMPIKKTVLSENNYILYASEPYQTTIIGKRDYGKWFEKKRGVRTSLKSVQLKAMSALLEQCQTSAVYRPEWKKPRAAEQEDK